MDTRRNDSYGAGQPLWPYHKGWINNRGRVSVVVGGTVGNRKHSEPSLPTLRLWIAELDLWATA
jgi:hypothetical protein